VTSEYSSSDEEEKSDGGRALPERWEPAPPSPSAAEAVEETAIGTGAGAPVARQSRREAARATEVPVHAAEATAHAAEVPSRSVEVSGGAAVATSAAATTPVEPPRQRKRGFST
jgi:hypothetical protein